MYSEKKISLGLHIYILPIDLTVSLWENRYLLIIYIVLVSYPQDIRQLYVLHKEYDYWSGMWQIASNNKVQCQFV